MLAKLKHDLEKNGRRPLELVDVHRPDLNLF